MNSTSGDSGITASAEAFSSWGKLTVDLLETFKVDGLPDLADTSKSTVVAKLRCFLRDAFRRGWISQSLVDRVKAHRAVYDQKEPYSDEEVEKILNEALNLTGGTCGYAKLPKTFRLLLELMLETGMRVGDAIRINPALVTKGEHLWIYTYLPQKHKKTENRKRLRHTSPIASSRPSMPASGFRQSCHSISAPAKTLPTSRMKCTSGCRP